MTVSAYTPASSSTLTPEAVPLGSGPPTHEELLVYYPAKFTWQQLKTFVNSGDLGLLKRDRQLQKRYNIWAKEIKGTYGSVVNYLLDYRLQWGKPDVLSKLPSRLDTIVIPEGSTASVDISNANGIAVNDAANQNHSELTRLPPIPPGTKEYFTADISQELVSIIQNDWPYSVPANIEHALIWTLVPMIPPNLPPSVRPRIHQDGLWGFTGLLPSSPPPSPSLLPTCLPALAEWGITNDSLIRSERGSPEEEEAVRKAGIEIQKFVCARWKEKEWETAWFVNPPRLQSVPGLAHIHVFARYKSLEEITQWDAEQTDLLSTIPRSVLEEH